MKNTVEEYCPRNPEDWRNWLQLNHTNKGSIWLIFHKKGSRNFNLSWSEAVDEALCFGWIDSTKRSIDETQYKQYFCKRKAKSHWSKVNKEKIQTLILSGRMQKAGYRCIEQAKLSGSWTALDHIEALKVPAALAHEFDRVSQARHAYEALSTSQKKLILFRVYSARREETVKKRVRAVVSELLRAE